jgi:hypothetical protein
MGSTDCYIILLYQGAIFEKHENQFYTKKLIRTIKRILYKILIKGVLLYKGIHKGGLVAPATHK